MILLTGATGYLGTLVLARLLADPEGEPILCPVRADDDIAATARMDAVLDRLWAVPGPARRARIRACAADLTQDPQIPGLGEVTLVLHCAAAVAFDLPLDTARATNVDGTRFLANLLAEDAPRLERFVHVSTAYVSGRHDGTFTEGDLDLGQAFRNTYEQTKLETEVMLGERDDLPLVVARPSIVVGEAPTGWTCSFNVLYPPLRAYARGLLTSAPADPDGLLDIVTGDYVADALLHLLTAPGATGTYNLTAGVHALPVHDLSRLAAASFDRAPIELRPDAQTEGVFAPYFDVRTRFDRRRAAAVLGPAGIEPADVRACFPQLMAFAQSDRWGKRMTVRDSLAA